MTVRTNDIAVRHVIEPPERLRAVEARALAYRSRETRLLSPEPTPFLATTSLFGWPLEGGSLQRHDTSISLSRLRT
jgi:hypothetical protein